MTGSGLEVGGPREHIVYIPATLPVQPGDFSSKLSALLAWADAVRKCLCRWRVERTSSGPGNLNPTVIPPDLSHKRLTASCSRTTTTLNLPYSNPNCLVVTTLSMSHEGSGNTSWDSAKVGQVDVDTKDTPPGLYCTWKAVLPIAFVALFLANLSFLGPKQVITSLLSQRTRPASSYFLCSAQGATAVHTVDERNTVTECVAIDKEYVVGTGTLGMPPYVTGHCLVFEIAR